MKDIKSLYLTAKTSGNPKDISAYSEAVHDIFENNPVDYIPNLEYIISSDIGLQTLTEFVEKYGLPICCYDDVMACLEKCIHKCEVRKRDDSEYKEAVSYMESFKRKYIGCFMMEAYFSEQELPSYVSTYYRSDDKGIQNRRFLSGMIDKYGECAIPDIIVTADSIGEKSLEFALFCIENCENFHTPVICEWMLEATHNIVDESSDIIRSLKEKSVSGIVDNVKAREKQAFKEAVITADDTMMVEYTESEVKAMEELLSITEYKMTWCDELNESVSDIQNTIYSLYESLGGIDETLNEDIGDSVVPMLPGSKAGNTKPIKEAKWMVNTRNKKTGDIPGYIKRNHNLDYGEDDASIGANKHGSITDDFGDGEPTLDDFKRPSAVDSSSPYTNLDDDEKKDDDSNKLTDAERKAINNYYYYTYNNSLNKTTGSFNKDSSSRRDDHSTHTSSNRTTNDHSSNKRVNSNNNGVSSDDEDDEFNPVGEGVIKQPWELDIFNESDVYTEGVLDKVKDALSKKKKAPSIPPTKQTYTFQYLPLNDEDKQIIMTNIHKLKERMEARLNPIFAKYPVYKLHVRIDEDDISSYFEITIDDPNSPGTTITIPGLRIYDGNVELEITPEIIGSDQYDFKEELENNYPDEVKRLSSSYDITNRHDWSSIHWGEKICGYDKNLTEITTDIEQIIMSEFTMIRDYDFVGDNDSGPCYEGKVDEKYIFPIFDSSRLKTATWTWIPKSFSAMTAPEKHFFGIYHNHQFSEGVGREGVLDTTFTEGRDVNFPYTYRTVKATNGKYYIVTFDIDGPSVVNYKLHYADANNKTTKIVGTIPSAYLMKYGNDNYVSKGNKIISIKDIRTGKEVKSIKASGGVPADGENIDEIQTKEFDYTVGELSPLSYKSTVPIYPMAGTVVTSYGSMKGMNIKPDIGNVVNPFASRRIDFSKPLLYKDKYSQLAILLKPALLAFEPNLTLYKNTPLKEIESIIDKDIKSNRLYDDYLIHPLDISEYDKILLMSSMFVHNCANNINKKPWKTVPDIYKGLLVGFFGPPIGGEYKYININIMEPITSPRYKVNTNVIQNIQVWFTFLANSIATAIGTNPDKTVAYRKQEVDARNLIKDTFYGKNNNASIYEGGTVTEAVGDADDDRPESDHPIKDVLTDIDRDLTKKQQSVKRAAQNVQNVGRAFMKPAVRTSQWINNMVTNWKDADENSIKERMADPHARSNLFSAITKCIQVGALYKAGLLLNPIILCLSVTRGMGKNKKHMRLRNEMIGEIKTELEIIDEKIKDADRVGDNAAKYKLMRFKNELNKKLLRVGGTKGWDKII